MEIILIAISILLLLVVLIQSGTINNLRFDKDKLKDLHYKEKSQLISMISWFSSYKINENNEVELVKKLENVIEDKAKK